ncbi:MAG: DUF3842 family protein [Thermoanaerobacteraceae bacterium]|nr:DUF3842 family protein [Thermoanaerobacteraceae bacterium]
MRRDNLYIAVIDGQGGGLGRAVIERIRQEQLPVRIIALGTNSTATFNMLKGGADEGATGENAITVNARKADLIIGPIAIIIADSLMGELTPRMAEAVSSSEALKLLIPSTRCNVKVLGTRENAMQGYLDELITELKGHIGHED